MLKLAAMCALQRSMTADQTKTRPGSETANNVDNLTIGLFPNYYTEKCVNVPQPEGYGNV